MGETGGGVTLGAATVVVFPAEGGKLCGEGLEGGEVGVIVSQGMGLLISAEITDLISVIAAGIRVSFMVGALMASASLGIIA